MTSLKKTLYSKKRKANMIVTNIQPTFFSLHRWRGASCIHGSIGTAGARHSSQRNSIESDHVLSAYTSLSNSTRMWTSNKKAQNFGLIRSISHQVSAVKMTIKSRESWSWKKVHTRVLCLCSLIKVSYKPWYDVCRKETISQAIYTTRFWIP